MSTFPENDPEKAPEKPSGSLVEPSDVDRLERARDRLERALHDPSTSPRDLAAVSRELRLLLATLSESAPASQASPLDELRAKRRERGA